MQFNFGATPFKHPLPSGYVPVNSVTEKNLVTNTVSSGATPASSAPLPNAPQAIIIEPSRELAEQTFNQIEKFKKFLDSPNVRELLVIGGVNVKEQISALHNGIDIVVGTPGRLEDLIQGGKIVRLHSFLYRFIHIL